MVIFFVSISSVSAGFGNDVRGLRDIVSNTNPTPTPEPTAPPTNNTQNSTDPGNNNTNTSEFDRNTGNETDENQTQTPEPQEPEYDYEVIPGTSIPAWRSDTNLYALMQSVCLYAGTGTANNYLEEEIKGMTPALIKSIIEIKYGPYSAAIFSNTFVFIQVLRSIDYFTGGEYYEEVNKFRVLLYAYAAGMHNG